MQIVGLNTELEVAIAHHTTQYKISPCSELNMEQLQIIIVMLACVPACGNDTISFRLIVGQHCCFMTVGIMYTPRVATGRSHVDSGKLPFTRPPTIYFADLLC